MCVPNEDSELDILAFGFGSCTYTAWDENLWFALTLLRWEGYLLGLTTAGLIVRVDCGISAAAEFSGTAQVSCYFE